jgi:hypothetical protein
MPQTRPLDKVRRGAELQHAPCNSVACLRTGLEKNPFSATIEFRCAGFPRPEVQLLRAKGHQKRRWLGAIRPAWLCSEDRRSAA